MALNKVIDISSSLEFISDYNTYGIGGTNSRITASGSGSLTLYSTVVSTSSTSGAIVLKNGGLSINVSNAASSSTSGGALTVAGGVAINQNLIVKNGMNSSNGVNTLGNLFTNGGSVGINTASPNFTLDVNGTANFSGGLSSGNTFISLLTAGNTVMSNITVGNINFTGNLYQNGQSYISSQWTTDLNKNLYYTGGNIGILTTSPGYPLDVAGSMRIVSGNVQSLIQGNSSTSLVKFVNTNSTGPSSISFGDYSSSNKFFTGYANGGVLAGAGYLFSTTGTPIKFVAGSNTQGPIVLNASDNSLNVNTTTNATDIYSGALNVAGGAGIQKNLYVGNSTQINGDLNVYGQLIGSGSSSSTYAYLTLTATDEAVNLTTGSLVTFGGVTIQAPDDATSSTSGNGLLVYGGAAVGKSLYVGNNVNTNGLFAQNATVGLMNLNNVTVGSMNISNISTSNLSLSGNMFISGSVNVTTITTVNLVDNNVSAGNINVSNLKAAVMGTGFQSNFSNAFTAGNNVTSATDVTNFSFDSSLIRSFTSQVTVSVTRSTGGNLYEFFTIDGHQTDSGWKIYTTSLGDTSGVTLSITSAGQVQYTSTNISNWSSTILCFAVNQIYKSGFNPTPVTLPQTDIASSLFTASNNVSTPTDITGFVFSNAVVRGFKAWMTVSLTANTSNYCIFEIEGIQTSSGWVITTEYTGDNTGTQLFITSSGQMQYTSSNVSNFVSCIFKFRAIGL